MINWKQREMEWARAEAITKEKQLRELKEQAEAEHDEHEAHGGEHRHTAKRGKSRQ